MESYTANKNQSTKKQLLFGIPLLLWITVIFLFSGQSSEEQSIQPSLQQVISEERLSSFIPDFTITYGEIYIEAKREPYRLIEFLFRKSVHVIAYGLLALFAYLALRPFISRISWKVTLSLVVVLLVAIGDEWNQSTVATRTGAVQDVVLDLAGGILALFILWVVRKIYKN